MRIWSLSMMFFEVRALASFVLLVYTCHGLGLLEGLMKYMAATKMSAVAELPVEVESLQFKFEGSLIINNIRVFMPDEDKTWHKRCVIHVDRITVSFPFFVSLLFYLLSLTEVIIAEDIEVYGIHVNVEGKLATGDNIEYNIDLVGGKKSEKKKRRHSSSSSSSNRNSRDSRDGDDSGCNKSSKGEGQEEEGVRTTTTASMRVEGVTIPVAKVISVAETTTVAQGIDSQSHDVNTSSVAVPATMMVASSTTSTSNVTTAALPVTSSQAECSLLAGSNINNQSNSNPPTTSQSANGGSVTAAMRTSGWASSSEDSHHSSSAATITGKTTPLNPPCIVQKKDAMHSPSSSPSLSSSPARGASPRSGWGIGMMSKAQNLFQKLDKKKASFRESVNLAKEHIKDAVTIIEKEASTFRKEVAETGFLTTTKKYVDKAKQHIEDSIHETINEQIGALHRKLNGPAPNISSYVFGEGRLVCGRYRLRDISFRMFRAVPIQFRYLEKNLLQVADITLYNIGYTHCKLVHNGTSSRLAKKRRLDSKIAHDKVSASAAAAAAAAAVSESTCGRRNSASLADVALHAEQQDTSSDAVIAALLATVTTPEEDYNADYFPRREVSPPLSEKNSADRYPLSASNGTGAGAGIILPSSNVNSRRTLDNAKDRDTATEPPIEVHWKLIYDDFLSHHLFRVNIFAGLAGFPAFGEKYIVEEREYEDEEDQAAGDEDADEEIIVRRSSLSFTSIKKGGTTTTYSNSNSNREEPEPVVSSHKGIVPGGGSGEGSGSLLVGAKHGSAAVIGAAPSEGSESRYRHGHHRSSKSSSSSLSSSLLSTQSNIKTRSKATELTPVAAAIRVLGIPMKRLEYKLQRRLLEELYHSNAGRVLYDIFQVQRWHPRKFMEQYRQRYTQGGGVTGAGAVSATGASMSWSSLDSNSNSKREGDYSLFDDAMSLDNSSILGGGSSDNGGSSTRAHSPLPSTGTSSLSPLRAAAPAAAFSFSPHRTPQHHNDDYHHHHRSSASSSNRSYSDEQRVTPLLSQSLRLSLQMEAAVSTSIVASAVDVEAEDEDATIRTVNPMFSLGLDVVGDY